MATVKATYKAHGHLNSFTLSLRQVAVLDFIDMMGCAAIGAHARLKPKQVFTGSGCTLARLDAFCAMCPLGGLERCQSGAQPVFCMPAEMLFMLMIRLSWQAVR